MSTYGDKKLENINIFYDTMRAIKVDTQLSLAVRDSLKNQKVILEEQSVPVPGKRYGRTDTVVSGKKTLEAAREYKNEKVCVLNFASATNPGGGVEKGSSAQEECICRCSTLYPCLASVTTRELFYVPHRKEKNPLYNDDIVYTPGVVVLKDDRNETRTLPNTERYQVDVVTAAAPNLRAKPSNYMNPGSGSKPVTISQSELKNLLTKRIRRVFSVCASNEVDVLILGAFGCGAFCNPPRIVAEAFKTVLEEFNGVFKTAEFAVYCPPGKEENYDVFRRVLS